MLGPYEQMFAIAAAAQAARRHAVASPSPKHRPKGRTASTSSTLSGGNGGADERSDLAGLKLAWVPPALAELRNIRNAEVPLLEDPALRRKLADALTAGIVSFLRRH